MFYVMANIPLTTVKNYDSSIKEHASIYVPAIGKVTIAVLMRNLLVCLRKPSSLNFSLTPDSVLFTISRSRKTRSQARLHEGHCCEVSIVVHIRAHWRVRIEERSGAVN